MQPIGFGTLLGQRIDQWLAELAAARRSPLTLTAYRADLRAVGDHLAAHLNINPADVGVGDITRDNLVAAFERFAADHSPASIRRAMATWGSLCRHLTEITDDLPRNPVQTIRRPDLAVRPPRLIADEDYPAKIMAAAGQAPGSHRCLWPIRDVALLATYLLLGVRLSEALNIRPRDIDHSTRTTTVLVRGKRSYERSLVVPAALLDLWRDYIADATAKLGALDADIPMIRHPVTGQPLSRQQGENVVDLIYRRAGIRDKVPAGALVHSLRHGFATESLRSGASLIDLRDHLGHTSLTVTDQYLHSDARRRRELVEQHPFLEQIATSSRNA